MNEDKWVIRYWKKGETHKYHGKLDYDIALVWNARYLKQGYDIVVMMRDKR